MGTADKYNMDRVYITDGERMDKPDVTAFITLAQGVLRRLGQSLFDCEYGTTFYGGVITVFSPVWASPTLTVPSLLLADPNYEVFYYAGGTINLSVYAAAMTPVTVWGLLSDSADTIDNRVVDDGVTGEQLIPVETRYTRVMTLAADATASGAPTADHVKLLDITWSAPSTPSALTQNYLWADAAPASLASPPQSVWSAIQHIKAYYTAMLGAMASDYTDTPAITLENAALSAIKMSAYVVHGAPPTVLRQTDFTYQTTTYTISGVTHDVGNVYYTVQFAPVIPKAICHGLPMVNIEGVYGSPQNKIINTHLVDDGGANWNYAVVVVIDPTTGNKTTGDFYFHLI